MSAPEIALIRGVFDHLAADASVRAVLGHPARISADPPADPLFPFLCLGPVDTRPADSASCPAHEHAVTLHAYGRDQGRAEVLALIAVLRDALRGAALTLTGHRLVLLIPTYADVLRAADGRTVLGLLRLRAITEPL